MLNIRLLPLTVASANAFYFAASEQAVVYLLSLNLPYLYKESFKLVESVGHLTGFH
jgi:hypothetical protein